MKQKLFIGMLIVSILGVAGAHFYGQTSAQDPPAKTEPAEKKGESDLFDALKKALEGKKDTPPPLVPAPTNVAPVPDASPVRGAGQEKPVVPPPSGVALPTLPALPAAEKDQVPLPATFNGPGSLNNQTDRIQTSPLPPALNASPTADKKPGETSNLQPIPAPATALPPVTPVSGTDEKKNLEPAKPPVEVPTLPQPAKPLDASSLPPSLPQISDTLKPAPKPDLPSLSKPDAAPSTPIAPKQAIVEQVAKMKNCAWSLQIEIVEGQTIVVATVNKKHEFKIVCQSLDLQTGKHTLKATGKVQITGDMMSGSCDSLAIPLLEDRLVMEGAAEVSIQKNGSNVSDGPQSNFMLKGASLDLRISDVVVARPVASSRVDTTDSPRVVDPITRANGVVEKQSNVVRAAAWSSYGTLARTKLMVNGQNVFALEDSQGKLITHLMFREGASMDSYLGRSISVYGPLVTDTSSSSRMQYMRVTHIALP